MTRCLVPPSRELGSPNIRWCTHLIQGSFGFIHDIDTLIELMNLKWYAIRRRFYMGKENIWSWNLTKWSFTALGDASIKQTCLTGILTIFWDYNTLKRNKRNRSTLQWCDCPFSSYFRRFARTLDQWDLIITNEAHNHEPTLDTRAIPALRRACRSHGIRAICRGKDHRRLTPYRNLWRLRHDWPSSNQARCIEYPSYVAWESTNWMDWTLPRLYWRDLETIRTIDITCILQRWKPCPVTGVWARLLGDSSI